MELHTFSDGTKCMASRHINGGGWVAESASVSETAYVGEYSEVLGGTIMGGTIMGGTIMGGTIMGGTIRGGTIWGGTIWGGTIWGGTIEGGTIRGGTIISGTIMGGTIRGGTIWGGTIKGGTIWGGTIEGGTIRGGTITKDVTFICGCLPHQVTITDNFVGIGCQWRKPSYWIDNGVAVFIKNGQSASDAKKLYQMLIAFITMHDCKDE